MNHRKHKGHLNRDSEHYHALLKNLAIALITCGTIKTTLPKAKHLQPFVEKLLTKAKKNTLSTRRYLIARLRHKDAINRLFELAPRYVERPGGYTRVLKCGHRVSDAAPMAYIQWVD